MRSGLFITGTDTEVGKTFVACSIVRQLRTLGQCVAVYKPVASGGLIEDPGSDPSQLALAAGMPRTQASLKRICPQFFSAALAPPMAAKLENRHVDDGLLVEGFRQWQQDPDWDALVVEGAGGVLSPISQTKTVLDLIQLLSLPVVVVAANRLGVVNHVLLTLAALENANANVLAIVLNSHVIASAPPAVTGCADISASSNLELLRSFTKTPVVQSADDLCSIAYSTSGSLGISGNSNNQDGAK